APSAVLPLSLHDALPICRPAVVGVIHVGALPGTPRASEPLAALERRARAEAGAYRAAGVDAVMVENMHDVPYLRGGVGPEIVARSEEHTSELQSPDHLVC